MVYSGVRMKLTAQQRLKALIINPIPKTKTISKREKQRLLALKRVDTRIGQIQSTQKHYQKLFKYEHLKMLKSAFRSESD